jgi:CheY-like chemotaxis protein
MLTAYPDARAITQYTEGTIGRMLTKPWNDHALKRAVLEAVRERRQAAARRDTRELMHAISFERRSPAEILSAVGSFLQFAGTTRSDAMLLLRNIRELEGSIPEFLLRLADTVALSGVRVSLADPSGMARAFLDIEPDLGPLSVRGPLPGSEPPQRVLIVEPLPATRDLLRDLVRCEGHVPRTAGSAVEALRELESGSFEAVILDLPRREGLPILQRLGSGAGRPRVVLLSDSHDFWDEGDCRNAGVDRLFPKPYRVDDVLEALRSG